MPTIYVVKQGDCMTSIARRFGFADYRKIYDDPANQELRNKRPNPNLLYPGDQLIIPDLTRKTISLASGQRHRIVVKLPKKVLKVKLEDADGKPLQNVPYQLEVSGRRLEGKTDGGGILTQEIPADAHQAILRIARMVRTLLIGSLDPMKDTDGITGVQARLANLGYTPGPVDGALGPLTQRAIDAFRQDSNLDPSEGVDNALIAALERAYGC